MYAYIYLFRLKFLFRFNQFWCFPVACSGGMFNRTLHSFDGVLAFIYLRVPLTALEYSNADNTLAPKFAIVVIPNSIN